MTVVFVESRTSVASPASAVFVDRIAPVPPAEPLVKAMKETTTSATSATSAASPASAKRSAQDTKGQVTSNSEPKALATSSALETLASTATGEVAPAPMKTWIPAAPDAHPASAGHHG